MENKGQKDIVPELLEKIKKDFEKEYNNNKVIQAKLKKLAEKSSEHIDTNEYAQMLGRILSKVLRDNITSEVLPDGKMYYNIAKRILDEALRNNHKLVSDYLAETQTNINHSQGYGIRGIKPKYDSEKAKGLVDKLSETKDFEKNKWVLDEGVQLFTSKVADEGMRVNAELHYKAEGLSLR